ncbi:hypothetical protein NE237_008114 [Protea cynaroides]|uniref:Methyltransferase type 11 domain-containing protein n=1 Tax=Protea cynaroides TaxID=273540 RepID=A0A9Q0QX41_9MAGN|nr:hypothetical protein NE237_008114 [Protea cynaroides]
MKNMNQTKPVILKPFLLFLSVSLVFLFIVSFHSRRPNTSSTPPARQLKRPSSSSSPGGLRVRPGFGSYDMYIQHQLDKTLNPKLREVWTTRDWERKIKVFSGFFNDLKNKNLLSKYSKALCVGARVGQEVAALQRIGVSDSIGMDLVPYPPLVVAGDFHNQPFANETFDFEFSNVFDHALYPSSFVGEIERTLKPGGICVLHVSLTRRSDKYSANDLYSVKPLVELFHESEVVHIRTVDGFGLDTEVVLRKKMKNKASNKLVLLFSRQNQGS